MDAQLEFRFKQTPTRQDLLNYLPTAALARGYSGTRAEGIRFLLWTIWKASRDGRGELQIKNPVLATRMHKCTRTITTLVSEAEKLGVLCVRERIKRVRGQEENWYAIEWDKLDEFYKDGAEREHGVPRRPKIAPQEYEDRSAKNAPTGQQKNGDRSAKIADPGVSKNCGPIKEIKPFQSQEDCIPPPPSTNDWAAAAEVLKACKPAKPIELVIREAQRLEYTPEEIIRLAKTFLANVHRFDKKFGAFLWRIREGFWPVDGVREPEQIAAANAEHVARVVDYASRKQQQVEESSRTEQLEMKWGEILDAMQPHERSALICRADESDDPSGLFWLSSQKHGSTARGILLEQLEKERDPK